MVPNRAGHDNYLINLLFFDLCPPRQPHFKWLTLALFPMSVRDARNDRYGLIEKLALGDPMVAGGTA